FARLSLRFRQTTATSPLLGRLSCAETPFQYGALSKGHGKCTNTSILRWWFFLESRHNTHDGSRGPTTLDPIRSKPVVQPQITKAPPKRARSALLTSLALDETLLEHDPVSGARSLAVRDKRATPKIPSKASPRPQKEARICAWFLRPA